LAGTAAVGLAVAAAAVVVAGAGALGCIAVTGAPAGDGLLAIGAGVALEPVPPKNAQ
jgi:hypothetical protein